MIIDASVILRAFFPDEAQAQAQAIVRDHVTGQIELIAPDLLPYELSNALLQAERRGRLSHASVDQIIQAMQGLTISLAPIEWGEMLPLARQYDRSAYDAAYLFLAQQRSDRLVTGDRRLYNAVHPHVDWVLWIEDYPTDS